MNEGLFFLTILISFMGILIAYRYFGKTGLFVWIGFSSVIANLEVSKCVDLFGLSVTLGNVIYGTVFLATDIVSEIYGAKEARKGVWLGLFSLLMFTVLSQISLLYIPNAQDQVSSSMQQVFGVIPRICVASMVTYFITNMLDTYSYEWLHKRFPKQLWLRNNGSTISSQLLDSFLFTFLAFFGTFQLAILLELSITTFLIKIVIALLDTPFLYIAKQIHQRQERAGQTEEERKVNKKIM